MGQLTSKQVARLESLLVGLQDFLDSVRGDTGELTDQLRARIDDFRENLRCLYCEKPLVPGQKVTRGCHGNCYALLMQRVRRGEETFAGLVEKGWINPVADKPGRRSDRPDPMRDKRRLAPANGDADRPARELIEKATGKGAKRKK